MIGHREDGVAGDGGMPPRAALTRNAVITAVTAVMLLLLWLAG
ncbi:protein of unknown function [Bradyrhizobium sp. ORS 285]|nr:protein of unknown function [Bradyrhizobium sp. ORS 285]